MLGDRELDATLQAPEHQSGAECCKTVISVRDDGYSLGLSYLILRRESYNRMNLRTPLDRLWAWEPLNFVLTNRVPRRWLTRLVGRLSKCEHPWIARISLGVWRAFADIDLTDAATQDFRSMHDCFTRKLRPGARPIAAERDRLTSPCDGIVGACGTIEELMLLQAKQHRYTVAELVGDATFASSFADGCYITLRLTSGMYHRFHAPHDGSIERITYFSGDAWNVNPPALKRIPKLFCRNERAVLKMRLADSDSCIAIVPVAAILVAGIRVNFLDLVPHLERRGGTHVFDCNAKLTKGDEIGWFEHGSTIIVLAPAGFRLSDGVRTNDIARMGMPLMRRIQAAAHH